MKVRLKVGLSVLASVVLSGAAIAAPQYAVDGLVIGTQLNLDSASYREYKCSPSEQFGGLTWCQKTRTDKERGRPYTAGYSLLHAQDGNIVYVNRSQEPSFFTAKGAQEDVGRYAGKIGETPRLTKMPHRKGLPDGLIATWGEVTLVQLDEASVKLLSTGKSPKKGLLIDFLGNFVRSAKEGLPIYRITGGPGFVWAASFDQKGRGTLRMAGVDASGLISTSPEPQAASEPQPALEPAAGSEPQPASVPEPAAELEAASEPEPKSESPATALAPASEPQATSLPGAGTAGSNPQQLESSPTIEKLQRDLASATSAIAQLEKAKAAAEAGQAEAAKAKRDAETARRESEQARATEKAKLDKKIAQLEAASAVAYPKANRWENALYGSVGGLLIVLLGSAMGFLWKQHNARKSATSIEPRIEPTSIEHWAQSPAGHEGEPFVASPAIAIAEDAFGRELEQQVAALNATETETETPDGPQADSTGTLDAPKDEAVAALAAIDRVSNCASELTLACQTDAPPVAATAEGDRDDSAEVSAPPPEPIARVSCPA